MRKPVLILDAGPNTVVGPRAKVMEAVRGGYTKFAFAEKRPHSDVPWSTLVLTFIVEEVPCCDGTHHRRKDVLKRISDPQQFKIFGPADYAGMGEA